MAKNPLEFIHEVETRARSLNGDRTRRGFDAIDELRTENIRLHRELADAREETKTLRDELDRLRRSAPPTPVQAGEQQPTQASEPVDDTAIRFSLLDLD